MTNSNPEAQKEGLPLDSASRKKIRGGLSDPEKEEFDDMIKTIDAGKKLTRKQRELIRKWKGQKKIPTPSKSFRSPSDKKTHQ